MKIKNLAFFGIMAAIMGVAGTARADTTTVIASQAYVDAKDGLDEKTANKETATYAASTNKTSTTAYPSMATLADAYNTLDTAIRNVDLSGTLNSLDFTDGQATGTGTVVKSVTQTDGKIAVTKGTIANDDVASDAAIADSKIAFTSEHTNALNSGITSAKVGEHDSAYTAAVTNATGNNVVATHNDNTNLLKGTGLQTAVAHLKGNGATNYTANVNNTSDENTGIKNGVVSRAAKTAWDKTLTDDEGDNYLTTLAAVERRVQEGVKDAVDEAVTQAGNNFANKDLDNLSDTGKANIAIEGKYSRNTTYTDGTVGAAITTNANNIAANTANIATNTTNITKLNGDVSTDGSVLKSIKDNAQNATFTPGNSGLTSTNLADAIKEVKTTATSGLDALDVSDTATSKPVTAVNQTNGKIAVTRGEITYAEGLKYNLSNINTESGDGSSACVKGSPCTLTMFMNGSTPVYEWTNMDTENTDAVL